MSFALPPSRDSTTEPSTPEPECIDSDTENLPFGDFARLVPISRDSRIAFDQLVVAIKQDPIKHSWPLKFVYIRKA